MKISLLIIFSFAFINCTFGCTCMELDTRIDSSKYFNSENEIFIGKVIKHEVKVITKDRKRKPGISMNIYQIEMVKNYSLTTEKSTIKVYTSTGNCGMQYEIGSTYLILTSNPKSKKVGRTTSICSRNIVVEEAQSEINLLDKLK